MTTAPRLAAMIRLLCCFTLLWSPIPLGSNRPWAWTLLELMIAFIFSLHLISVCFGRSPWFAGRWQQISLLPFVAVLAVSGAQLFSFAPWLSTVDPNQTEILWFKTLFYALFAWLILAGSAVASYRLGWKEGVRIGLIWAGIFVAVFLVFSMAMG